LLRPCRSLSVRTLGLLNRIGLRLLSPVRAGGGALGQVGVRHVDLRCRGRLGLLGLLGRSRGPVGARSNRVGLRLLLLPAAPAARSSPGPLLRLLRDLAVRLWRLFSGRRGLLGLLDRDRGLLLRSRLVGALSGSLPGRLLGLDLGGE